MIKEKRICQICSNRSLSTDKIKQDTIQELNKHEYSQTSKNWCTMYHPKVTRNKIRRVEKSREGLIFSNYIAVLGVGKSVEDDAEDLRSLERSTNKHMM